MFFRSLQTSPRRARPSAIANTDDNGPATVSHPVGTSGTASVPKRSYWTSASPAPTVLFFTACLLATLAFAVDGFAKGSVGQGVVGLIGGIPALWLIVRGVRIEQDGVYIDYRRPVWDHRDRDKPEET